MHSATNSALEHTCVRVRVLVRVRVRVRVRVHACVRACLCASVYTGTHRGETIAARDCIELGCRCRAWCEGWHRRRHDTTAVDAWVGDGAEREELGESGVPAAR